MYICIAFTQPATGPSSVCQGSDVTLQCRIVFNSQFARDSVWSRNGASVTPGSLPNHRLVINSTTGAATDLVITNVTLDDDNIVYSCSDANANINSSLVLNVTGNGLHYNYVRMHNYTYEHMRIQLFI